MGKLFTFLSLFLCSYYSFCQGLNKQVIGVGIVNNEFLFVDYTFRNHLKAQFTQSIFVGDLEEQNVQLSVGYKGEISDWMGCFVAPQARIGWTGRFVTCGLEFGTDYHYRHLGGEISVMPYYDSAFNYKTCYRLGVSYDLLNNIGLAVRFTNIPEYRDVFDKIQLGLNFHVKKIEVTPCISVPLEESPKKTRILLGFRYEI